MELSDAAWLFDHHPDVALVIDETGTLLWASGSAERAYGWRRDDWLGQNCLGFIHPDDLEMALLSIGTVQDKDVGTPIELRVQAADDWRLVELIGTPLPQLDAPGAILVSLRDITERRRWEVARNDTALFQTLIQNSSTVTMLLAPDGTIRSASAALPRSLGHDPGPLSGAPLHTLVAPGHRPIVTEALARVGQDGERGTTVEVPLLHRDGRAVPHQLTILDLVDDPTVRGLVVAGQDISELHEAREELRRVAANDPLTGLANRATLQAVLAERLRDDGSGAAVAFLDVDRFKPVNDLYGHEAGDDLLRAVGNRLRHLTEPTDVVARLGGDEFVVVSAPRRDVAAWAERLDKALGLPYQLPCGTVQVNASVGAVCGRPGDAVDTVLSEADATMYAVKHGRRGGLTFQHRPLSERRALAEGLERAFAEHEFTVHYQPLVDTASNYTVGHEALVRWNHPRRGLLVPAQFLDVVEDIGRVAELDTLVLQRACGDLARLELGARVDIDVSVNASAAQLTEPGFPNLVLDTLVEYGVRPDQLVIEVSERSILERPEHGPSTPVLAALRRISELGVRIAVDDFGTGYSSLSHLVSFPVDVLKIDQSFVAGITQDPHRRSVVAALISLADGMDLRVVAEGVETSAQAQALADLGCVIEQGYLHGGPRPIEDIVADAVVRV